MFHPLPGLTQFLWSCPKKVSKEMRARDGERLLEFMSQEGEGKNSLRSDSFPSFFLPATEIQGAIKGRNGPTIAVQTQWWVRGKTRSVTSNKQQAASNSNSNKQEPDEARAPTVWPLTFLP
ncbi:hypothetical protein [Ralstonia pickettii]|uniref:hypothetical protein n=1 Tax=Ralstonia pickettii TaxID=329 RepID=UPI00217D26C4|nr:hypothetical protein [Ralstonia pickettii]